MKLPDICFVRYQISDLSENNVLAMPNAMELRQYAHMLVIDDNEFIHEKHLKNNGYQLQHKTDIDTIKDVEPYDIVLCDISGVGKKLGYDKEGAFIIKEIAENYPNKRIIAYTANTYNPEYNEFFSMADFVATKDMGIDDWICALDSQVRKSIDPVEQWKKIRDYLIKNGVSTLNIVKIEDRFVDSVKRKNFDKLKTFGQNKDLKLKSIITEFTSSLCAKVILGAISGG